MSVPVSNCSVLSGVGFLFLAKISPQPKLEAGELIYFFLRLHGNNSL